MPKNNRERAPQLKISFPADLIAEIDQVATAEERTRAGLIREMARRYIDAFHADREVVS